MNNRSKTSSKSIEIQINNIILHGDLQIPDNANAIILFAHGSGSSRLSPRNRLVAHALNQQGFATLLFDLLTSEEEVIDEQTREFRFDIPLLAARLKQTTDWLISQNEFKNINIAYFGASTGAAAALIAAAQRTKIVKAVVSRGGRPDLVGDYLPKVKAPTLLIVGGWDEVVIELNKQAQSAMQCEVELKIIPEATHLFEEPGKLEEVIQLASKWFSIKMSHD